MHGTAFWGGKRWKAGRYFMRNAASDTMGLGKIARLRIFNPLGALMWERKGNLSQAELMALDPGPLAPGTYLFEVRSADGCQLFSERFVVLGK